MGQLTTTDLERILGDEAAELLEHSCETISADRVVTPGPDIVDRIWADSDRSPRVLRSLQALFTHGRMGGTGYLSILPVDHGTSYSGGTSFAPNPIYFDPENILRLASQGGCSTIITTHGLLGAVAHRYAHKIPLVLKLNHHQTLSYPNVSDQRFFARVEDAWNMGCVGVAATVYFGSPQSNRQLVEISRAFARAHERGLATILFCYLRNQAFRTEEANYELSADLTGQANHLGVTIEADIIKQKQPVYSGGYRAIDHQNGSYGKWKEDIYSKLIRDHPIDWTRYQVGNCYAGRCGLVNSGGASGANDLQQAVRAAVINKRAGGIGLISGRKAFQREMSEGVDVLHAIQDVYLNREITLA